jgi:N-acetylmuramic acid 6-phosphate etherase
MKSSGPSAPWFLGIEAGGTRTVALLADANGRLARRLEAGPANLRLLSDAQLIRHLRGIARAFPRPAALCLGFAGARGEKEWDRLRAAAAKVWPGIPCRTTNDLETALAAATPLATRSAGGPPHSSRFTHHPQILVLSGTGSCFFGRTATGRTLQFGGWGHILGDKGSGFEIALRALKAVVYYLDRDGEWSRLGQRLLRALHLNEPNDLIPWVQAADKTAIAALAPEVFAAAAERDATARDILTGAAHSLAKDALSCARRLLKAPKVRGSRFKVGPGAGPVVQFVLAGSVLLKQPRFAAEVARLIREGWPGAVVTPLKRESAWGAVVLAQEEFKARGKAARPGGITGPKKAGEPQLPTSRELSPTERRHPRSMHLDRLPLSAAIRLMLSEDEKIPGVLLKERARIEQVVRLIVRAFKRGGRLFYVGAGTSGRLGILDASECPPTFRADPEMVQGIIAGGQRAITTAIEGAEDDFDAGRRAVEFRGVTRRDVVVGIAASGRTPFVWGALHAAKSVGATTVLVCFNPHLVIPRAARPDVVLAPDLGPEILTGSTRLKSGTATKLLLNLFTTLAMARLGKVLGNLMVDLNPSNVKLRDRAVRIVRELTGADAATARQALMKSGWVVKRACARLGRR